MNPLCFPCLRDTVVEHFRALSACTTALFSPSFFCMLLFTLVDINKLKKSVTNYFKGLGVIFGLRI